MSRKNDNRYEYRVSVNGKRFSFYGYTKEEIARKIEDFMKLK